MFSGCEDAQTSADVQDVAKFGLPDASGAGGACTNAVLANVVSGLWYLLGLEGGNRRDAAPIAPGAVSTVTDAG